MMIAFLGGISFFVFIFFGIKFLRKKGSRKRNVLIIGISFLLLVFFMAIDPNDVETEDNSKNKEAEQEKKDKEEQEKKDKKKEKVKTVVEKMEKYDVVKSAEIHDGELTITYEPEMGWSENSLFRTVYDSFEVTNQAFKDDSVDSVLNLIEGVMVDQKGNEELKDMITYRYYRSDFEKLKYSKFKEMAIGEQWRILNEADGYFIHPGIRANLKEKYTDNLN